MAEGSNVVINFTNREGPTIKLAERLKKEYNVKTTVIQALCISVNGEKMEASDNGILGFRIVVFSLTASIASMRESRHLEDLTL